MNIIDELVVVLGIDPTKFTKGQKDALDSLRQTAEETKKLGDQVEAQGASINNFFSALKRGAVGILASFIGFKAVKDLIFDVNALDAATGRIAKTMNMSSREVSAWAGAVEQAGGKGESAVSTLSALTQETNRFMLTGQSSMLPALTALGIGLFDMNGKLKSAGQLMIDLSGAVEKMDPARASAFLGMLPGMNQDSINLLIKGKQAVLNYLDAAKLAGATTEKGAEQAQKFERDVALLGRSWADLGRTFSSVTGILGGMTRMAQGLTEALKELKYLPYILHDIAVNIMKMLPDWAVKIIFGSKTLSEIKNSSGTTYSDAVKADARTRLAEKMSANSGSSVGSGGGTPSTIAEREARIRRIAAEEGVDPEIAVKVWESEGKYGIGPSQQSTVIQRDGTREKSYGPFQLYMGGGLGNTFMAQTGLDPRDPSTFDQQVRFSMQQAKRGGWGPWHGWKGHPRAGLDYGAPGTADSGGGSTTNTTTVTVGKIEVNGMGKTGTQVGEEIREALKRQGFANSANTGLQ